MDNLRSLVLALYSLAPAVLIGHVQTERQEIHTADRSIVIVPEEDTDIHKRLLDMSTMRDREIRQFIEQQVKDAMTQARGSALIPRCISYPKEFDIV